MDKSLIIEMVRGKIGIPHNNERLNFIYPAKGPGTYQNVMEELGKEGLLRPTTSQTVSLIYEAIKNQDNPICKEVIETLKEGYWTSTENLLIPKKGIFVYDNIFGQIPKNSAVLEKMLQENNPNVRFVPLGFDYAEHSKSNFIKNPYLIANIGKENVEKIAEIADKFKYNPQIWTFGEFDGDSIDNKHGYTMLHSNGSFIDDRLVLHGHLDGSSKASAFGISN